MEIRVAADDAGKVIGRQGRVIKSIRVLARAGKGERAPTPHCPPKPSGEPFDQGVATEAFPEKDRLLFICGHYEGHRRWSSSTPWSASSPACSVPRTGRSTESFSDGLWSIPSTRALPSSVECGFPDVLLSGDHGKVAKWRREQSLLRTARLRPDLLADVELSPVDRDFLQRLGEEG